MGAPKGNKNALGNNGGQKPLYDDPLEFEKKVDKYFIDGVEYREFLIGSGKNKEVVKLPVYTMTGLALYLGFESRQSLYDYESKVEFSYIIKKAKTRIEKVYEENLQFGNTTGAIFALKNMGWMDKFEHDVKSSDGTMSPKSNIDLSKLNDKELLQFKELQNKIENA